MNCPHSYEFFSWMEPEFHKQPSAVYKTTIFTVHNIHVCFFSCCHDYELKSWKRQFSKQLSETTASMTSPSSREVCWLSAAWTQDVVEELSKLVQLTDFYQLLLFHVVINDAATGNPDCIRSDYKALGIVIKVMEAQVVSSSVSLVRGRDTRGEHK